jgi:phosphoadenosine phosphosulfate reductase
VAPLEAALGGFAAWVTGRKRYQGGERRALATLELADGRIKANPLAPWSASEIAAALRARGLPRHPLLERGYRSVGCAPCTAATTRAENARGGRWPGLLKTECGIHRAGAAPIPAAAAARAD